MVSGDVDVLKGISTHLRRYHGRNAAFGKGYVNLFRRFPLTHPLRLQPSGFIVFHRATTTHLSPPGRFIALTSNA
jgi:hypothetical protein